MVDAPVPVFSFPLTWGDLRGMLRRMAPTMVIDGLCPVLLYLLLRPRFPDTSLIPLVAAAVFPLLGNVGHLGRYRRLDTMGLLVLLSLASGISILLIGGDQRLLLIARTLMPLVLGLACLVSMILPKPLAFYMMRQMMTGDEVERVAAFNAAWQHPYIRFVYRLFTVVFGLGMVGQFAIRVVLVFALPIVQALVLSEFAMNGLGMGIMVWTIAYGRHAARHTRAMPLPPVPDPGYT